MAAHLVAAGTLVLVGPAVWVALRFTDRWLGAPLRTDLRTDVHSGMRRYRLTVALMVPADAFADLPWAERGRRPDTLRRPGFRRLPAPPATANLGSEASLAERRR